MRRLLLTLALFAPMNALAVGAQWPITDTPRFWLLGEGRSHLSVDGGYFQTKEDYDKTGAVITPPLLQQLSYTNLRFHIGYGFAPKVSLFAQADGRMIAMKSTSKTVLADATNMGAGDVFLGLRWLLYRSRASDHAYPTEWTPDSWMAVAEGTWNFPLYDRAAYGKPPLGEQSNDFTGLGRLAWYANDWLALSGSLGYTYRTAAYAAAMPWNLRADFTLTDRSGWRFFANLESSEGMAKSPYYTNPSQTDPIPNGSLLFKSDSPTIRTAYLGGAKILGKEWEAVAAGVFTASGVAAAKGLGLALGLAWRPYQVPEIKYQEYHQQQIERLRTEKTTYRKKVVTSYGLSATILKVSGQGNYFKIAYGLNDGIKTGDNFQIFPQDDLSGAERRPIAISRVVVVHPSESFLRVEQKLNEEVVIQPGQEARRVIISE